MRAEMHHHIGAKSVAHPHIRGDERVGGHRHRAVHHLEIVSPCALRRLREYGHISKLDTGYRNAKLPILLIGEVLAGHRAVLGLKGIALARCQGNIHPSLQRIGRHKGRVAAPHEIALRTLGIAIEQRSLGHYQVVELLGRCGQPIHFVARLFQVYQHIE